MQDQQKEFSKYTQSQPRRYCRIFLSFSLESPFRPSRASPGWMPNGLASLGLITLSHCLFYRFPFPPPEPSSLLLTPTWPKLQGPLVLIGQEKVAFPVFLRVQAQIFLVLQSGAFTIQQNPFLTTFDGITTAQQLQQVLLEAGWGLPCLRNSEEVRVNGVNGAEWARKKRRCRKF